MLKRVTWFITGTVAGAAGATAAKRSVKKKAAQLPPVRAAKQAVLSVKTARERVVEAAHDGRDAMRETEARLRARRNGDVVAPIDIVDGRIVAAGDIKPGQVVVLREVREQFEAKRAQSGTSRKRTSAS